MECGGRLHCPFADAIGSSMGDMNGVRDIVHVISRRRCEAPLAYRFPPFVFFDGAAAAGFALGEGGGLCRSRAVARKRPV